MQLLETADECCGWDAPFDDTLLKELAKGIFQSSQYQPFFEQGHSKAEVKAVEDRLAEELADTYRSILKRYQDPVVQSLNALL